MRLEEAVARTSELFGEQSPIGQSLRVNSTPLVVIGVLERKGANTFGADQDDIVLAPWRTIKFKVSGQSAQTTNQSAAVAASATGVSSTTRFPSQQPSPYPAQTATEASDYPAPPLPTFIDQILVRIGTEGEIPGSIRQITALLKERHRIRSGQPEDFNIRDTAELSNAAVATSR